VQNAEANRGSVAGEHEASLERDRYSATALAEIACRIVTDLSPASVLDTGCADGALVEKLRELDVDARASGNLSEEPRDRRADLLVSVEARGQAQALDAERLIESLCASADRVLFSPSPAGVGTEAASDVRNPEDWSALFARHNFFRKVDFDASFVAPEACLYERSDASLPEIVRAYDRSWWRLRSLVQQSEADARAAAENLRLRQELLIVRDDLIGHEARLGEALGKIELLEAEVRRYEDAMADAQRLLGSRTGRLLRAWHRLRASLRA